ncbi:peptidylprolyl isomerase [Aquimonas voraii]|uniref:peptidylprolyl isomerase n=1 Tax=Aquimonas voraii TaxID=265719 RepID=A0A1G7A5T6_9GAMM|nr:peptidylprolyl isomerase [Aquimonas voraii]SDE10003.1 peptidylprolyl isomerase [Aquimonas voraii]
MRHLFALSLLFATAVYGGVPKPLSSAEVLAQAPAEAWRAVEPENLVLLELDSGTVYIELAPAFAPKHAGQLRGLIAQGYFDGLAVLRSQDNYVAQWGDPLADDVEQARPRGEQAERLAAEFDQASDKVGVFTPVPDGDVYAPEAGFIDGFPAARDPATGRSWLAHCYGTLGAGRDNAPDSGSAAQLYVVTGHAPRHLDRNVTLFGRVLEGIEHLSSLPRGRAPLGFYAADQAKPAVKAMRLASAMEAAERPRFEVMRTDSDSFRAFIESRRFRYEAWFAHPAGRIEVCNVAIPTRRSTVAD